MATVIGLDAEFAYNTGTYATPTWTVVDNVRDVNAPANHSDADVTTRGSGNYRETEPILKELEISWEMVYDTGDADFAALQGHWDARTAVELFIADGDVTASGTEGFRVTCKIHGFDWSQPFEDVLMVKFVAKPVKNTDSAPEWYTVP